MRIAPGARPSIGRSRHAGFRQFNAAAKAVDQRRSKTRLKRLDRGACGTRAGLATRVPAVTIACPGSLPLQLIAIGERPYEFDEGILFGVGQAQTANRFCIHIRRGFRRRPA